MLYAPPVNRGNVCLLPDFPKLHDVRVELKTGRKISSVTLEPECREIAFEQIGDRVSFELPPFRLHQLVILR